VALEVVDRIRVRLALGPDLLGILLLLALLREIVEALVLYEPVEGEEVLVRLGQMLILILMMVMAVTAGWVKFLLYQIFLLITQVVEAVVVIVVMESQVMVDLVVAEMV
jgi:hypothetical protein